MLLAAHRVLKYATNVYSFMYVRKCVCHDYSNAMRHAAQRTSHSQATALYLAWHFAWNAFCPFKCIHLLTVLRQPYLWQSETQARTEKNTHTKNGTKRGYNSRQVTFLQFYIAISTISYGQVDALWRGAARCLVAGPMRRFWHVEDGSCVQ